jgi:hypothetical protein
MSYSQHTAITNKIPKTILPLRVNLLFAIACLPPEPFLFTAPLALAKWVAFFCFKYNYKVCR